MCNSIQYLNTGKYENKNHGSVLKEELNGQNLCTQTSLTVPEQHKLWILLPKLDVRMHEFRGQERCMVSFMEIGAVLY